MNLYHLSQRYNEIADLAFEESDEEGQISREFVRLMSICEDNINAKLGAMCRVIRELEAVEEAAKNEAARLTKKRQQAANHVSRIKDYMKESLDILGTSKIKVDDLFTVAIQASPVSLVIENPDSVPRDFDKPPVRVIDNAKVKDALKAGQYIPGCSLVQGTHVRIR